MRNIVADRVLRRRDVLGAGAGVAGGLAISAFASRPARAASAGTHAPVGTWPAGVAGPSVFVGITAPLTGAYAASGKDLALGFELAFAEINEGGAPAKIHGLSGRGLLGKQIRYKTVDTETRPNVAVEEQTRFVTSDKAILMAGGGISSSAIALEELAQREKVIYMVGTAATDPVTGKNCQRYAFRSQANGYMIGQALVPALAKKMGNGLKVSYLVPDYTWGHTMFNYMETMGRKYGWTVSSKQIVPVGASDFSSQLLNIAGTRGDLLVNLTYGADAVTSIKQAAQFGIPKKMKTTVPSMPPFLGEEVGSELIAGITGVMGFLWNFKHTDPIAASFVKEFYARNKYHPRWAANIGYMQAYIWAQAVERAKTFYPPDVIKELEASHSRPFNSTLGKVWYRAVDHQLAHSVLVVQGKEPSEAKASGGIWDVVAVRSAEEIAPPDNLLGCHLGPYT